MHDDRQQAHLCASPAQRSPYWPLRWGIWKWFELTWRWSTDGRMACEDLRAVAAEDDLLLLVVCGFELSCSGSVMYCVKDRKCRVSERGEHLVLGVCMQLSRVICRNGCIGLDGKESKDLGVDWLTP